jgi:Mn2+/Fe2+ NRAMP family transporter
MNSSNIFLFEKKKIDLRNLMYPKVNNENILPFRCSYRFNLLALFTPVVTLLRLTFISAILIFCADTVLQMSLCLPVNVITLLYFIKAKPYSFKQKNYRIKNYIAIYHEACLIIFELLMLGLGLLQKNN